MKKIIIILLTTVFSLSLTNSIGQSTSQGCQTEPVDSTTFFNWPYFGNNQYLLNLVDSLEGSPMSRVIPTTLRIPVTAWVYHINNLADNITNNVVEQYINAVNQFFINNNSRIRLYLLCNINHITDNRFYNNISGSNNNTMFDTYYTPRTFNIHFTNNTADGFARGRFPWKNNPYACFIPTFFNPFVGNNFFAPLANTLAHEIGHGLGLLHTHDGSRGNKDNNGECGNCYQESVSRTMTQGLGCISTIGKKKCEVNADCLCDTDGDPLLLVGGVTYVLPGCAGYDRTSPYQQDNWGSQWLPAGNDNAIRNIMSYSSDNCRIQMTTMQRGVEYFYSLYKGTFPFSFQFESFYRNDDVDNFENDNFFQNASNIIINNPQTHSFHLVPDQNSNYTGCDVDWVRFVAPCTNNFQVFTGAITGRANANTRLTLFDNTIVQLAQNDDISATNQFSSLTFNFIAGREYFIRVENMNPNSVGYYSLNIGIGDNLTITGDNNVCGTSNNYTVANLPAGATVQWQATGVGGVTINSPNSTQTTLTQNSDGVITLTATITIACGQSVVITKTITVGTPPLTGTINFASSMQPLAMFNNITGSGTTYVSYSWPTMSNISITTLGSNPYTPIYSYPGGFSFNLSGGLAIRITGTSTCGTVYTDRYFSRSYSYKMVVSPNPAKDNMKVSITDEAPTAKSFTVQEPIIITLYNASSTLLVKRWKFKTNQKDYSLNVQGIKMGQYILVVEKGKDRQLQQITIQ